MKLFGLPLKLNSAPKSKTAINGCFIPIRLRPVATLPGASAVRPAQGFRHVAAEPVADARRQARWQGGKVVSAHVGGKRVQMMEGTFRLIGEG